MSLTNYFIMKNSSFHFPPAMQGRQDLFLLPALFCCFAVFCSSAHADNATTLYQSVQKALGYSPQLQALSYNHAAAESDLHQSRSRYYPSVDLLLGYGPSQYNDRTTRRPNADPGDEKWQARTDATLKLSQKVYDGGETAHSISVRKALVKTADFALREAAQATALEAINAHLDVVRQRQLVALAAKDLQVHKDIYRALAEFEQAGTGDIADVTQTKTRIAWADSNLTALHRDLDKALSQYERVVGKKPGSLAFAGIPKDMPDSLQDALQLMEHANPALLASGSKIAEAEARTKLARSNYHPRVNVELSSSYFDNMEGEDSWRQSNEAMVVLRWNLFNGGQDHDAVSAATARTYESRFDRKDKLAALRDTTTAAWATYNSLLRQKQIYREATLAGKQTFEAYMQQFSVSRRSLLDVLNAEREFFQSAQKFISAGADEVITAYFILQLEGMLHADQISSSKQGARDFEEMRRVIDAPSVSRLLVTDVPAFEDAPGVLLLVQPLVVEGGHAVDILSRQGEPQ